MTTPEATPGFRDWDKLSPVHQAYLKAKHHDTNFYTYWDIVKRIPLILSPAETLTRFTQITDCIIQRQVTSVACTKPETIRAWEILQMFTNLHRDVLQADTLALFVTGSVNFDVRHRRFSVMLVSANPETPADNLNQIFAHAKKALDTFAIQSGLGENAIDMYDLSLGNLVRHANALQNENIEYARDIGAFIEDDAMSALRVLTGQPIYPTSAARVGKIHGFIKQFCQSDPLITAEIHIAAQKELTEAKSA